MSPQAYQSRRRTVLVTPRLQVWVPLVFSAVVLLGGALFAWLIYRGAREALWAASLQGHFRFNTPYDIVGHQMVRQLAALFAVVVTASIAAFLVLVRRIRAGLLRLVETLRLSREGDLSTPTNAPGIRDLGVFGSQLDAIRGHTLGQIEGIREEVGILRKEPLPPEEFQLRWDRLKEAVGRIVP